MDAYRANPLLVPEHGRQEDTFRTGGYAQRQVLELVQNAADALSRSGARGRIQLVLRDDVLYCANEGAPFSQQGLQAVCQAYLSENRGDEMGRFGLGFKSVLGITDAPTILSRSISFSFSAETSRQVLSQVAPRASKYPVLRLPGLIDVEAEMEGDPLLAELGEWAETVIRLPLSREVERLAADLQDLPKEFLLFAPFVSALGIALPDGSHHEFRCESQGDNRYRLIGAEGASSDWMVWHQTHRPSDQALAEVSEAIQRSEVKVTYAAPLDETQTLGRFWAYFPLMDFTSARGIHNAPWHISDDRTNLLPGQFNEELLQVVADLVVNALPQLTTADDPARHFDYLPARGRESDNFADVRLTERIPELASLTACVPDADGTLRLPSDLEYPNADLKIEVESLVLWHSSPGRPVRSPHWTCFKTATRKARLRRLVRGDTTRAASSELGATEWLEQLVPAGSDAQCDAALQVYFSVADDLVRRDMNRATIVPDSSGNLCRLSQTTDVFLHGNPLSAAAGIRLVRPSYLVRERVEERLRSIGFEDVDPRHELRRLATNATNRWGAQEWQDFWDLVLEVSVHQAEEILLDHVKTGAVLKVRCRDGTWQHVGGVVVPGVVEPVKPALVVDDQYHQLHLGVLTGLGVGQKPVVTPAALRDLTQLEFLRLLRVKFLATLPPRGRPDAATIDFAEEQGPAPLHVLRRFADSDDDQARMIWTRELLEIEAISSWTLHHPNHAKYQPWRVKAPHLWAAQTYGLVATCWGPREAARALHPDRVDLDPMLPVAAWSAATKLKTIDSLEDVPVDIWREFLSRTPSGGDPGQLGTLIFAAFGKLDDDEVPECAPAVRGEGYDLVPTNTLLVAGSDDEIKALREQGLPFVAIDGDSAISVLIDAWGCQPASATLRVEIVPNSPAEPVVLLDRFRRLRDFSNGQLTDWKVVGCSGLQRVVTMPSGTESHPEDFAVSERTIYFENSLDDEDLLGRISARFDLGLSLQTVVFILGEAESERVQAAMASSRIQQNTAARLLVLLPVRTLEAKLPIGLLDTVRAMSKATGDMQIAELLVNVHGYNVLGDLRHELKSAGYPVPETFAGSPPAVAFVRSLGFPAEFAGERGQQLDSDITVLGPPRLKPLHEYQERLATEIIDLVRTTDNPGRALLFLPTGAGKTRVAVEALVRAIRDGEISGPVLWVAQTEELCEQAVQTWASVWREFGDRPLRLCRLWSKNEVAASDSDANVVVAMDAKLDKIRERDEYDWLREAAAVVIDEAHGATAVGITATLRWLGIDQRQTARPLLGLTATPFKGTGAEANERLATRFGGRLLDVLGPDPYGELQRIEVLARVEHRVLPGSSYVLDVSEKAKLETFRDIPQSVLDRVGRDRDRTLRLLEDICAQPRDWPILVFTSSVLAAQTLSALLRVQGIPSAAVSGSTPTPDRRRSIEAFRDGGIQVLTNCNVLTQGFDAPGVRALYIARPTFSPNAYIQMVGRGLRGPANGGKPECMVVNVADTFEAFGEDLAYKEFDYLWENQGSEGA